MCPALGPADRDGFDLAFLSKHVNVHPNLCAPVPGTLSEVTGRDVQSWNRHQVSHRTPGDAPAREGRRRQRYGPTCSRPHRCGRRGGLRELSADTEVPREQHVSLRSPKERDDPFSRCRGFTPSDALFPTGSQTAVKNLFRQLPTVHISFCYF